MPTRLKTAAADITPTYSAASLHRAGLECEFRSSAGMMRRVGKPRQSPGRAIA
ncbi:MAG: hypothetical protein U0670_24885 [Anaerolineae bacterium]